MNNDLVDGWEVPRAQPETPLSSQKIAQPHLEHDACHVLLEYKLDFTISDVLKILLKFTNTSGTIAPESVLELSDTLAKKTVCLNVFADTLRCICHSVRFKSSNSSSPRALEMPADGILSRSTRISPTSVPIDTAQITSESHERASGTPDDALTAVQWGLISRGPKDWRNDALIILGVYSLLPVACRNAGRM